ncbi:MAG: hypothetical protein KR126chlam1_01428 [Chlamydiae bacterium]|nr:hypothetical protein [Chlamydiota bacterium]
MIRFLCLFLLLLCNLDALSLKEPTGELKQPATTLLELFDIPSTLTPKELVPYLKAHWLQKGKERWEMEKRCEEKGKAALPLLRALGCINSIHAEKKNYQYALVLGAMGKTMQRRLDFLYKEWKRGVRFDQIVLLTGERDLDPTREKFPEGLKSETDLFLHLFDRHPLKKIAPYTLINSPKQIQKDGSLRRPTTASTMRDWLRSRPSLGDCLAISTQPFVGYQEAVVRAFLPKGFSVEGVGPGTDNCYPTADLDLEVPPVPYPLSIYLDNIAKWLVYEEKMHLLD